MTDDDGRRRAAAKARLLADRLATDELPEAGWDEVTARLDHALTALSADAPGATPFARAHRDELAGARDPSPLAPSELHPLAQGSSAVFPPIDFRWEGEELHADLTFGPAWEGPPGLVHGGFLASGFDMVLSALAHRRLGASVTRSLRVRYLRPTFLGQRLHYETVAAEQQDGRLLELRGTLSADGRVTMRATAQFASIDAERFAERTRSSAEPVPTDPGI
ncbi:MAG TPA: PaaI family thioesterase [Acidimicrobiales bacterium]